MRQRRPTRGDPWEEYPLLDINTREGEPSRRPSSSRRGRDGPAPGRSQGQPSRQRGARPPRDGPSRRPPARKRPPQQRPRKPMGKGARRFLLVFTLLCMAAVTAFLCVFLLFKVRVIEITGDAVYEESTILDICGYQQGDNLALLTTSSQEQALEQQLPYIQEVDIRRHFPSTLEIHITAAQTAAVVASGSQWFTVSYQGKLLEEVASPPDGTLQVTGLVLTDPAPGGALQAQDEDHQQAFQTILSILEEWNNAGDFTALDLTDLYNITMNYQGRVVFKLGSTVGLDYKVDFGLRLVTDPDQLASNAMGTLDLSLAADINKTYFTDANTLPESGSSASSASGDPEGEESSGTDSVDPENPEADSEDPSQSSGASQGSSETSGETSQSVDRGDGIPDTPFTG